MFEDPSDTMTRPEADQNGNIVEPRVSPKTVLPPEPLPARPAAAPRISSNPDAPEPPVPGSVTTTTKTTPVAPSPVTAPGKPKMMQPILDPKDVKSAPQPKQPVATPIKKPEVKKPKIVPTAPVKKPVVAPAPATPKVEVSVPNALEMPKAPKQPENEKEKTPAASAPVIDAKQAVPARVKPQVEERITPTKQDVEERTAPIKRNPKQSAITGPKTMPALPTATIDQQKTFEADDAGAEEKETMLERHQHEMADEKSRREELKPIVPTPKANVKPAAFENTGQSALKKTLTFQQGQIGLSPTEIDPIAAGVTKELDAEGKEEWRVQIKSYATPYGTGVSSDKRIALSRALSLRTALISQGIPAARIDVLAEGQTSDKPDAADRIDLYLYGPEQE